MAPSSQAESGSSEARRLLEQFGEMQPYFTEEGMEGLLDFEDTGRSVTPVFTDLMNTLAAASDDHAWVLGEEELLPFKPGGNYFDPALQSLDYDEALALLAGAGGAGSEEGSGFEPNPEAVVNMVVSDAPSPFWMVNLIDFYEVANFPDGRDTDLSGEEANAIYGNAILPTLLRYNSYGALVAGLNGIRFCVLDFIEGQLPPGPPVIENFGGILMRLAATLEIAPGSEIGEAAPYQVNRVSRSTVFHYVAGRQVYELEDPDGIRYRMQSFTQRKDPDQQLVDLQRLRGRLDLPDGWSFHVILLEEDFGLTTVDGIAEVITDDLGNTYQRVP